ncbi:hypothetical protein SprV_0100227800 [Sparganum proliferum]
MQELISAPAVVHNTIGWTQMEATEYIKKFRQMFIFDESTSRIICLNNNNLTIGIRETYNQRQNRLTIVNTEGIVFCVSKSWGIIDLGQHEHVFFDRSLFKHVTDLTKHFRIGESVFFNAVLAPKGSRAKWHATQVWKETDCAAVRLNGCRTSENQTTSLRTGCGENTQKLQTQNEEGKAVGSDNSLSSLASLSDSFGDSDSGVQENAPTRPPRRKQSWQQQQQSAAQDKNNNGHGGSRDLNQLLSEIGVDTRELADSFKVVRLVDGYKSLAVGAGGAQGVFQPEQEHSTDQNSEPEEVEVAIMVESQHELVAAVEDDDNASTNSNLNTMSDIPSITAAAGDEEEKEHETLYNSPNERRHSNIPSFLKCHIGCCRQVDCGTQTYFTGPVMATQVYHDEAV